jgi:hypothetical protein
MSNKDNETLAGVEVSEEETPKTNKRTKKVIEKVKEVEHDIEDVVSDTLHETKVSFKPKSVAGRKFRIFLKRKFPNLVNDYYKLVLVMMLVIAISSYSYVRINDLLQDNKSLVSTNLELEETIKKNDEDKLKIEKELHSLKERLAGSSFVIVNKETLLNDMKKRFSKISPKVARVIVETVISEAKKYDINPIILYSLGVVESSHRFWIEHTKVLVSVPRTDGKGDKKIHVRAVGWGGVVWEHHYKMLQSKGIAQTRADLFYPDVNIKAAAAIYNMYFHMPRKNGAENQDVSAQRRYFGGNYKSYSDKINEQVVALVNAEIYRDKIKTKKGNVK